MSQAHASPPTGADLAQAFAAQRALRAEICRVGQSLFARAYVHSTAGNLSVRLAPEQGGGHLITPTDACLGFLDPERLAWVAEDGQQIAGDRASKTLTLHRRIYASDPAAGCVLHTHSTHLVALTLLSPDASGDLLGPITPYFAMKVGHVPRIAYHRPGDPAAADRVAEHIAAAQAAGRPIRAVMLDRLGPNVWHHSPAQAMAVLEELEETARLWFLARGAEPSGAGPRPLDAAQLQTLAQHFGAPW